MKILKKIVVILLALIVIGCAYFAWKANNPGTLPQFPECPASPNCVSSLVSKEKDSEHYIEPLRFKVKPGASWWGGDFSAFKAILLEPKRSKVLVEEGNTLVVSYESSLFGFEDRVRLVVGRDGIVNVRSASLVGHYDFDVNRKRVEAWRAKFAEITLP